MYCSHGVYVTARVSCPLCPAARGPAPEHVTIDPVANGTVRLGRHHRLLTWSDEERLTRSIRLLAAAGQGLHPGLRSVA